MTAEIEGPMREGILATHRQLVHALEMSGMTVIDPKDAKFDPNTQQAIAWCLPSKARARVTLLRSFSNGWKIHERVLRPAMVSVVQG